MHSGSPPIWNVMDASAIAAAQAKTSVRAQRASASSFFMLKTSLVCFFDPLREASAAEYVLSIAKLSVFVNMQRPNTLFLNFHRRNPSKNSKSAKNILKF
ncbi:MAG: hypothetical protein ACLVB5_07970 [Christensenellales bacterium]